MWYFAFVDFIRRVSCTSGLLIMPDAMSGCLFAIWLNGGFAILYVRLLSPLAALGWKQKYIIIPHCHSPQVPRDGSPLG